ncbi:YbgC/FadM family acyl-CoA thioesterase [Henriciella litoralis]|uniref:YbgC/FadM family acyl-CoA thioesterase n=1 Tax=Henriciella litoralis TaxID=568102 RepID=UPI0009FC63AE|nr:YbgC/FadM family acyl-CoA thioesterase [Henriciella litoralis]
MTATSSSPFDAQNQHVLMVRVYYEDTDFTGMVYHANYLRFFERGRSEFLRDAGVSHTSLLDREDPAAFTLTNVNVDYRRAARIDDQLVIRSRYVGTKGARVIFEQAALRDGDIIAEAQVTAVMIHADGRPRRPIPEVVEQLKGFVFKPHAE